MSPREAMTTPIAHIYMSLEGHVEYLKFASPFHGGPMVDEQDDKPQDVAEQVRSVLGKLSNGPRT